MVRGGAASPWKLRRERTSLPLIYWDEGGPHKRGMYAWGGASKKKLQWDGKRVHMRVKSIKKED